MSQENHMIATISASHAKAGEKLPGAIKALFERVIKADGEKRNDWLAISAELCVDKDGVKSYNTDLKSIRTESFAVLYTSKPWPISDDPADKDTLEVPTPGSERYKELRKRAQQLYGSCTNRALEALGYKKKKERAKATKKASDATAAQPGTVGATTGESAAIGSAMALQHEIVSRLATLGTALVAFQQTHAKKLGAQATAEVGDIAAQVATIASKCKEMGEALVGSTTPEQAAGALSEALKKIVTPAETEPATA